MRVASLRLLACLALGLAAAACEIRPPGPLEEDRGKVIFWEVVEADQSFEMCTDDPDWRAELPDAGGLVGAFLSYRLSEDGATATALACASTDPATCAPTEPPQTFEVTSHTLTYEASPQIAPVAGIDCAAARQTRWTLVDEGDELDLTISVRHELTGTATACAELDQVYVALGSDTNAFGIASCVVSLRGRAVYRGAR